MTVKNTHFGLTKDEMQLDPISKNLLESRSAWSTLIEFMATFGELPDASSEEWYLTLNAALVLYGKKMNQVPDAEYDDADLFGACLDTAMIWARG